MSILESNYLVQPCLSCCYIRFLPPARRFSVIVLQLFVVFLFSVAPVWAQKESDSGLARVAILKFINSSNSADHKWVENSLPDAIDKSMKQRFEFIRTDEGVVKQIESALVPKGDSYSQKDIQKIAKESKSDIVIYGYFKLTASKDKLLILAEVYNAADDKVIGQTSQESALSSRVFRAIDIIVENLIESIYRYTLQTNKVSQDSKDQKKLRLLVLVPSYTTAQEEEQAKQELESMKSELNGKYEGEFITIYEFFEHFKVATLERKKVIDWAKKRQSQPIITWLGSRGVKDAFIILVNKKKVNITPIVEGISTPEIVYNVDAKPSEKKKAMAKVTEAANVEKKSEKKPSKVSLTKEVLTSDNNAIRLLTGANLNFSKLQKFIPSTFAGQINGNFNLVSPWLNLYFSLDGSYGKGNISANDAWFTGAKVGLLYPYLTLSKFHFSLFSDGGAYTGKVGSNALFVLPVAELGTNIDFYISSRMAISLSLSGSYYFDSVVPGVSANAYLGAGYRL